MTATQTLARIRAFARPRRVPALLKFFQTGKGGYGEGDRFIGLMVPEERQIAREFRQLPLGEIEKLLQSPWHEARAVALMIMVLQYQRGDAPTRQRLFRLYTRNLRHINNWDLIDASAASIVGAHLFENDRALLDKLAGSRKWHERRVAVVATHFFIRRDDFESTVRLARTLLRDEHDLMHKAVGWMLREVGKRDIAVLRGFLKDHAGEMPRTMLRYSIEKMLPDERAKWMAAPRTTR